MAEWIEQFIIKNEYSRPGYKLLGVRGLVMHWTATPGASDENEVKFFDGADGGGGRYASAHLFVDSDSARLDIPLTEVAYHANEHACRIPKLAATASYYKNGGANLTTIGIEMCVERDGTIHPETVARSARVAAALCKQFGLNPLTDIYRHYDITGKNCPEPWIVNPTQFTQFKNTVNGLVGGQQVQPTPAPTPKPTPAQPARQIGRLVVTADVLNVREQPNANSRILKQVKRGESYITWDNQFGWYNVGGWVSGDYVRFIPGVVKVTADVLNVRSGPGVNYGVVKQVPKGSEWQVWDIQDGFYCLGGNQWISADYVSFRQG